MKTLGLFALFFSITLQLTFAKGFEDISLSSFEKEKISSSHYRFFKKGSDLSIHVQTEQFDPKSLWRPESLDQDVRVMFDKRQLAYSLLGFSEAQVERYSFQDRTFTLEGSYVRLSGKKINFIEKNFYYQNSFLQIKMIGHEKPSADLIAKVVSQIDPFSLAIEND